MSLVPVVVHATFLWWSLWMLEVGLVGLAGSALRSYGFVSCLAWLLTALSVLLLLLLSGCLSMYTLLTLRYAVTGSVHIGFTHGVDCTLW